jgi:hypothetical protein
MRATTLWYMKAATHSDEISKKNLLDLAMYRGRVPEAAAAVRRLRLAS